MISLLFVIHDSKANFYLPPFASHNVATAKRQFQLAACSEGHDFQRSAPDYNLFKLGEFDAVTGAITTHVPELLANASEFSDALERLREANQS